MGRGKRPAKRTPLQVAADEASIELAKKLGRMLKDGRVRSRQTQARAADRGGISQSEWSALELGRNAATVPTLNRAAAAVGGSLDAWIRQTSAAGLPRDAVHLRHQELIIRLGIGGKWKALPEEFIDRDARTSRAADVLLTRRNPTDAVDEYAFWDVWDWFDDIGASVRDFGRRMDAVDRYATARMRTDKLPRVGGCFVVRATTRNRRLIADHRHFFSARFPGSGHAWLRALQDPAAPLPSEPALIWVSVRGDRLFPARHGI
ncbi:MAG: helix-turn-helix transcriptional regulator [Chloroflexota bacterium]